MRVGYTYEDLEELMRRAGIKPLARDSFGGYGCIKATAAQRWFNDNLWSHLPVVLGEIGQLMQFLMLYPLILLDNVVPYPAWSIYVCELK